jgi:hypothetical protein
MEKWDIYNLLCFWLASNSRVGKSNKIRKVVTYVLLSNSLKMNQHVKTVEHTYEAFGKGNIPNIIGFLADDVAW